MFVVSSERHEENVSQWSHFLVLALDVDYILIDAVIITSVYIMSWSRESFLMPFDLCDFTADAVNCSSCSSQLVFFSSWDLCNFDNLYDSFILITSINFVTSCASMKSYTTRHRIYNQTSFKIFNDTLFYSGQFCLGHLY